MQIKLNFYIYTQKLDVSLNQPTLMFWWKFETLIETFNCYVRNTFAVERVSSTIAIMKPNDALKADMQRIDATLITSIGNELRMLHESYKFPIIW